MISFFIHKNIPTNGFMFWYLWIKDVLCGEVVEKYNILVLYENRLGKTNLWKSLCNDFLKSNIKRFFMLKTVNDFVWKVFGKVIFLALIEPIMATKINNMKKKPRRSHPREIVIPDKDGEQSKNNVNYKTKNTIQIQDSIAHYYQNKQDVNFIFKNEKKS